MQRRGFVRVVAVGAVGILFGEHAQASLSRAVRLEALVQRSRHVVLGEPLDAYSVWERVGERRRIVTYTRVKTHELLAGAEPRESELLVRTLGGQVGELGELVHGEAALALGRRSVLFTMQGRDALVITAMAQGHYPLRRDAAGAERLTRSPKAAELLDQADSAIKRLPGLRVAEARQLFAQAANK